MSPEGGATDPAALRELIDELTSRGFEVLREVRGGMEGTEILLAEGDTRHSRPAEVRLLGERRHWSLGLKFQGMAEHRTPDEWKALILDQPVEASSFDKQAQFVRDSLELARDTYAANPNAERELAVRGTEFMKRAYPTLSEFFDQPRGQGKATPTE